MAFGVATVLTSLGRAITADRLKATPATYANPPRYVGMGVGATGAARTAVAADTALSTPVESRTAGTESSVTTSTTGDTYQVVGTINASAARVVDEMGLFDASSAGNMFLSATFNVINLNNGDGIQFTVKVQYQ